MTINQPLACVLGKSCAIEGKFGDATPFSNASVNIAEKLCERLRQNGYSSTGKEVMINGMSGEPFNAMIFIGPTYYQRLKHLVSEKMHARESGIVTNLSRQPTEGFTSTLGLEIHHILRNSGKYVKSSENDIISNGISYIKTISKND